MFGAVGSPGKTGIEKKANEATYISRQVPKTSHMPRHPRLFSPTIANSRRATLVQIVASTNIAPLTIKAVRISVGLVWTRSVARPSTDAVVTLLITTRLRCDFQT